MSIVFTIAIVLGLLLAIISVFFLVLTFVLLIEKKASNKKNGVAVKGIIKDVRLIKERYKYDNAVYEKHKLPVKYQANGELTARYARFAMVNATATEDAFEGDLTFGSGAMKVSDSRERKRFESNMRQAGNSKFSLDNGLAPWIGLDGDDLYKGTIFIPIYNNIWNAMATTNSKISPSTSLQIETEQQKTDFRINSGYKSPGSWTNQ